MSTLAPAPLLTEFITNSVSQHLPIGIRRILELVHSHLGMDVAFVSEFVGKHRYFREVVAPGNEGLIKVGESLPLEEGYCKGVVEGRLPELIPDTKLVPAAMEIPVTTALPIGSHLSVPIRLKNGQVYGTFCCFSFTPNRSLNERDLQIMRIFADLARDEIERNLDAHRLRAEKLARVQAVMQPGQHSTVYQPIYRIDDLKIVGVECLARFSAFPYQSPDIWFSEATEVGLGNELEIVTIQRALAALSHFEEGVYLAINVSPEALLSREVLRIIEKSQPMRIVLEVTEHAHISDYEALRALLLPLRQSGLSLAVDDAGAGYSSLRHILDLQPDFIKLDIGLTRNVDIDLARRALVSALQEFARETGSQIIAEGVETASELETLKALGIGNAQGYFLARPMPFDGAIPFIRQHRCYARA